MTNFPLRGNPFYYILVFAFSSFSMLMILLDCIKQLFSKQSSENKSYEIEPSCLEDPSVGEHGTIELKKRGGIKIHYVANGSKSKPLILFVHGFPCFWYSWKYQLKEFGKDYYAVAIDMPGYGKSSVPSNVDRYSIGEISADVKEFILEMGYSSCTLVGHDWGALIVCGTAAEYPAVVDKLIVMNGPHRGAMAHISKQQLMKSSYMYVFQLPYFAEWLFSRRNYAALNLLRKGKKSKEYFTDETLDAYKYTFHKSGFTGPLNYYRMVLTPSADGLKDVEVPSILIWGSEDKFLSMEVAELTGKHLKNGNVIYVDGAGHFVNTEEPLLVNQHIRDFLCQN